MRFFQVLCRIEGYVSNFLHGVTAAKMIEIFSFLGGKILLCVFLGQKDLN